jgi:FkbM family methyltransferase
MNINSLNRENFENESSVNLKAVYVGSGTCLCWVSNRFKMYVPSKDLSLSPHLIINGYWESWISVAFLRLLNFFRPKSVVNVGANLGYFSLLASSFDPLLEVVAYEPQRNLSELIVRSSIINGYSNLHVNSMAAGSNNKVIWLNTFGDYYGSATVIDDEHDKKDGYEVQCVTLDSVREDPIDFMIIDAEGFEYDILLGAKNRLLKSVVSVVFIEFSSTRYGNKSEFIDFIVEMNFNIYKIDHTGSLYPISESYLRECNITLDVVLIKGAPSGFLVF